VIATPGDGLAVPLEVVDPPTARLDVSDLTPPRVYAPLEGISEGWRWTWLGLRMMWRSLWRMVR
jgi:hypothetical protein